MPRARIAAVTHLAADPSVSAIPDKAKGLPVTRCGAEDVLARDPDLILAGPWASLARCRCCSVWGGNVVIVPLAADLDGVRSALELVAKAVGEPEAGARAIAAFDARLAVAEGAAGRGRRPHLYTSGGSASAPGTLADAALAAAGYRNAALSYPSARNGQVPLEAIIAHPPELLVLASPPTAYRTVVADNLRHPALAQLTQTTASVTLPWRLWLCGTPHVAGAVEQLAAAHPSLKVRP